MAFLDEKEVYEAYVEATDEANVWRVGYPEIERLMDNGLMDALDDNLPEVNDGSLAASLFKFAKRVVKKKLGGRPIALDRDDKWINDLADIYWRNRILKNANTMATPRRKWKDIARKATGYGGQPIINLFVENGSYTGSDFIAPYCQDVKLEAGKASDMDSQIIFWDVYYTKYQVRDMIEQAKEEMKNPTNDGYNKWNIPALEEILEGKQESDRPGNEEHIEKLNKGVKKSGIHFYIAFQRGVEAPFMMCYPNSKKCVREWSNPDPTGDVPVHYLYYYQDFINPYGIGVVKLAGGTQNVLDLMRKYDILATQVGISPPKLIQGKEDDVDEDSMVMEQNANWFVGGTQVTPWNMANNVYEGLPGRISMYKTSLDQLIPTGDTSIAGGESGNPNYSKTPAGVKFQADALSVDDEDFSENIDECYALVARSMINTDFANMQGSDLLKLSSEERDVLQKAGIPFPMGDDGQPSNQLDLAWDEARATFDFEINPDADKTKDEQAEVEGLQVAMELIKDPATMQLAMSGPIVLGTKKVDPGELFAAMIASLTDNDKIVTDMTEEEIADMEEEKAMMAEQEAAAAQGIDPATGQPMADPNAQEPIEGEVVEPGAEDPEAQNIQLIMEQYEVPQNVAEAMREAELQGLEDDQIMKLKDMLMQDLQPQQVMPNA